MDLDPPSQTSTQALIHQLVEDQTAKILDKLLIAHRNSVLTGQEALSAVAAIAALRSLVASLDARTRTLLT